MSLQDKDHAVCFSELSLVIICHCRSEISVVAVRAMSNALITITVFLFAEVSIVHSHWKIFLHV